MHSIRVEGAVDILLVITTAVGMVVLVTRTCAGQRATLSHHGEKESGRELPTGPEFAKLYICSFSTRRPLRYGTLHREVWV